MTVVPVGSYKGKNFRRVRSEYSAAQSGKRRKPRMTLFEPVVRNDVDKNRFCLETNHG